MCGNTQTFSCISCGLQTYISMKCTGQEYQGFHRKPLDFKKEGHY